MEPLKKSEVLLMQEDVLGYCFQQVGVPFFQEDDLGEARRLFTPSVGAAVMRYRCANERGYIANIRKDTVKRLLEPSARKLAEFARTIVEAIFTSDDEENFMKFFYYLAFILDLAVFAHRYKRVHLMNPVFIESEIVFDAYLRRESALPFWKQFLALCNSVLRNSPLHGQPVRHFRNPEVYWDPRDPDFDPDDPGYTWIMPNVRLSPMHPILNPDRHAAMKKFWDDMKAERNRGEKPNEEDENLNNSNSTVQDSELGCDSNLVVQDLEQGVRYLNVSADVINIGGEIFDGTSMNPRRRSKILNRGASELNIGVGDGEDNPPPYTERLNRGAAEPNIVAGSSGDWQDSPLSDTEKLNRRAAQLNIGEGSSGAGADNPPPYDEKLNRGADELNIGAGSSGDGADIPPPYTEKSSPSAENLDTESLKEENPNPHPFEVIIAAMAWDIIPEPSDPAVEDSTEHPKNPSQQS